MSECSTWKLKSNSYKYCFNTLVTFRIIFYGKYIMNKLCCILILPIKVHEYNSKLINRPLLPFKKYFSINYLIRKLCFRK